MFLFSTEPAIKPGNLIVIDREGEGKEITFKIPSDVKKNKQGG